MIGLSERGDDGPPFNRFHELPMELQFTVCGSVLCAEGHTPSTRHPYAIRHFDYQMPSIVKVNHGLRGHTLNLYHLTHIFELENGSSYSALRFERWFTKTSNEALAYFRRIKLTKAFTKVCPDRNFCVASVLLTFNLKLRTVDGKVVTWDVGCRAGDAWIKKVTDLARVRPEGSGGAMLTKERLRELWELC
ncbi:hypothetical protein BAUCODRAFT_234673 [Baudoinia panamericana UAMH 10762]|uniref:Uncharacterized protein n=1 Tax=Baudoinia panamericana (strain UAMH 10762) TaxID=717646 RepID=M2MP67_BAUPA|nr:uncharacterized protein BAUCODRAFT_234673 [Baudoinia panamericana UAMH 10762]EMC93263.1 hypothetical protein BAUCODRAFT_234673 [Baudoinia panamericana UAMH 10762]